jgi:glucokinase
MMLMAENKYIAIDFGGTNLRVGLVKGKRILKYLKKPTPKTKDKLLDLMISMISQVMSKDVKGIGVGSPGPLKDGVIKNPPNIPLKNFDLQGFLRKKFKIRVVVGNDADIVALAEAKYGVKKKNFVILTLGTGVGGGIIINGELFHGEGYAGELGNIIVHDGRTMEQMWQDCRRRSRKSFGKVMLVKDLLKSRDKRAKSILNDTARYLGQGIASLVNVFDPEIVVLKGGVRETGNKFLRMIRKEADKYSMLPKKINVQWSKLAHPGILGASLLVNGK